MIQPEFKPLIDILNGKLFSIPEYQRHYSWKNKQRADLFRDILKLNQARIVYSDRVHFMATVVCLKTDCKQQVGSNSFFVYEVVDGQQRLTTLIILLKAISLRLLRENQNQEVAELNKLLVKDDGRLIILQNNHDNRQLLRNYLKEGIKPLDENIKTLADENIKQAIKQCETFVNSSQLNSIELLSLMKNSLYFIFQSLEDKGAVYTIFEVLNSRGLEVDWLDKCKSMLMGLLYENSSNLDSDVFEEHLKSLHSYWSNIYSEIGLQPISGGEIISFAATLKHVTETGSPLSFENALEFFRTNCAINSGNNNVIKKIEENTIWLKEVTMALSSLNKDKRRNAVTEITQARLLAISIMLRKDLSEDIKDKLLNQWERTTFRIYGIFDKDSRNKRGDFIKAAKIINNDKTKTVLELLSIIANIGNDFPIEKAIESFRLQDCYNNWQKKLKYFFYRYEEYLANKNGYQIDDKTWNVIWESNLNESIEHILPQNKNRLCWQHISDIEHGELLNTIGNLILLSQPLNSEAKDNCIKDKLEIYKKTNLQSVREVIYDKNESLISEWTIKSIRNRTEKLMEFVKYQWSDI
jgi:2-hydroxy-3-keto-5-methylthiopentenyl-1-phosphate phosphatase